MDKDETKKEFIKSLGWLEISTGILFTIFLVLYWVFLNDLILYLISLIEGLDYLLINYILNYILVITQVLGIFMFVWGIILIKMQEIPEKLKIYLKINSIIDIFLFPFGTILGFIILRNFKVIDGTRGI